MKQILLKPTPIKISDISTRIVFINGQSKIDNHDQDLIHTLTTVDGINVHLVNSVYRNPQELSQIKELSIDTILMHGGDPHRLLEGSISKFLDLGWCPKNIIFYTKVRASYMWDMLDTLEKKHNTQIMRWLLLDESNRINGYTTVGVLKNKPII